MKQKQKDVFNREVLAVCFLLFLLCVTSFVNFIV